MAGGLVPRGIEGRGAIPAQTVGVLPGTPGSATQAHRRSALLLGAMVSTVQLESGTDDCEAGDPHRLASPGVQAVLAVEVAAGKTADSGKSSPADDAHGAGEPDLGRRAELSVKLGILVSPRTVRAYGPQDRDPRGGKRTSSQRWRTFVRNHAKFIVASDFLVAITAGFRVLYVFVVMEVGSRRSAMSRPIRLQPGPCGSFEKPSRAITPTDS